MEHPLSVAFCPLYFRANGGTFDPETGKPQFREGVRALCPRPHDCGECTLLHQWVGPYMAQGWSVGWECDDCLRHTRPEDAQHGRRRFLPGFYQAGRDPNRLPEDPDYDPDRPGLAGCTRCGWETSLLQLVLRLPGGGE